VLFDAGLRHHHRGIFLRNQPELEKKAWDASLAKTLEIGQELRAADVRWLVMIVPTSDQVRYRDARPPGEDYRLPNKILTEFFSEHGVEFIDLLPLIEQQADADAFYYRRDLHWTPEGHRFAAEVLAERLWVAAPAAPRSQPGSTRRRDLVRKAG
jgi:hypothetical protein